MAASSSSAAESLRRARILPGKLYFDVPPSKVARNDFDPELVVYNAGTDVLGDPLGRLKVCPDGVSTRDESLQICQGKKYTTCYAYIRWLYEVER
ncbi:uncharacterized protein LOC135586957 isoform X2 [Musa acuminata AAA Group]|uniref:uncharacterized protein LOC135586957 isoform X2 n=1 Tax=Musa acuminata AAA Group TaxID=214697 RepID=UPI0031E07758